MPAIRTYLWAYSLGVLIFTTSGCTQSLPDISQLPPHSDLPAPLVMFDGRRVTSKQQWHERRRPELKTLFQHYMYGYMPEAPKKIKAEVRGVDKNFFSGKATKKEVTITFGPPAAPKIGLLLIVPNQRTGPAPVFLGLNFCGNHTLVDDPSIAITRSWMRNKCPGCQDNRATEKGRGKRADRWAIQNSIDRGYAVASFYYGDIDPDRNDFTDGVHPHYFKPGQTKPDPHDWGAIAAWSWGLHRAVDYLYTDNDIDNRCIAVYGHSRNGKAALLAAAFDERIDLVIPHQAGCGGTSPSRSKRGESVTQINTSFGHWFNDIFPKFNGQEDRLPFDQHSLIALVAPRPVLLTNGIKDEWADPQGQFEALKAADPVYRFLGVEGIEAKSMPPLGKLIDSRLGYYIRHGGHTCDKDYWNVFIDFADKHFH
ncbi:MAG: alpha/beta hydrolase family protein [Planctomycetota bacterium]|jgi:hypothetical protein